MNEPAGGGVPFATYLMFLRSPDYGQDFLAKLAAQEPRLYTCSAPVREDLSAGPFLVLIPTWVSIAMIQLDKRSDKRSVCIECGRTCRSRWPQTHIKKNKQL